MAYYQLPTTPNEETSIQTNNALFQENYQRSQNEKLSYRAWKNMEF